MPPGVLLTPTEAAKATNGAGAYLSGTIIPYSRQNTTPNHRLTPRLAEIREQFESAVLAEDWPRAARLQRRFYRVERRRRRELLRRAEEVRR